MTDPVDMLIIGGGINGTAIARDAAGQGLSVMLCEKDDLASATSSASTKLIHGGLRYLEYYEFRLVRESLIEREQLLRAAPHIIRPMRFVLPHHRDLRPAWLLRLGLFLYDHLGGRKLLPATETLDLRRAPEGTPLKAAYKRGFAYSDCWVDDARLVVLNAMDAAGHGADIRTRTTVTSARRDKAFWTIGLTDHKGAHTVVRARALVNAAGPWAARVRDMLEGTGPRQADMRLVKGSHIVVPRFYEGAHAYIFQNADGRVVFAIPYEKDFTLIGTTDIPVENDPDAQAVCTIKDEEVQYLCAAISTYFCHQVTPDDVIWHYCGVRPLYDDKAKDASAVTRDYVLTLDGDQKNAPVLSVFGGKITTSRKLAEHSMALLLKTMGQKAKKWTASAPLPGGDIPNAAIGTFIADLQDEYPAMPPAFISRLGHAYGTCARQILGKAQTSSDLGTHFGADVYEAELRYLVKEEWARTDDDILWRRSKLGLHLDEASCKAIRLWMAAAVAH